MTLLGWLCAGVMTGQKAERLEHVLKPEKGGAQRRPVGGRWTQPGPLRGGGLEGQNAAAVRRPAARDLQRAGAPAGHGRHGDLAQRSRVIRALPFLGGRRSAASRAWGRCRQAVEICLCGLCLRVIGAPPRGRDGVLPARWGFGACSSRPRDSWGTVLARRTSVVPRRVRSGGIEALAG